VHFQYTRIADWPPLAWLARCLPFERAIEVFHGDRVEITPDWFCEAIWAGPYDAGAFDRTDVVFGSGCRIRGARATFVSSASTVDRLQTLETPDGTWVSNSLACLLAAARATVDPLYPRYFEDFRTVREGLLRYRPSLASSRGPVRLIYYGNLEWDGGRLQQVSKPAPVRDFGSFVKYRAFLGQALRDLADNMGGRERRRPYDFLGTISTGYDSPTVAVLAREAGLATAITVDRSRGGASDSGEEIAARLGLAAHVVERDLWRRVALAEVPFIASDAKGEDVYFKGAEQRLVGTVLLTGFHGDAAWSRTSRRLNAEIVRKDQSGLSLSEYRLWIGFIHCPVPFLGIRQLADINAISRSPDMARWDWPRGHSRPICRRIVEEAHQAARDLLEEHRKELDHTAEILLRRETIEREEFIQLLDGKTEEEVFGPDEPVVPQPAPPGPEAPQRRPEREAPRPLPRPGLAGGAAEMRAHGGPRRPDLT